MEHKGARMHMEDFTRVDVNPRGAFFGVYDGHGGEAAAAFCSDNLHVNVSQSLANMWQSNSPINALDSNHVNRISQCVRDAFVHTDQQFLNTPEQCQGGTTACVAMLINDTAIVGNVGDSRAVLCRGNTAVPLSCDHTPARHDEVLRIRNAGGDVVAGEVVVGNEDFSLTRSIGNSKVKVPPGRDYHDRDAPQVVTSEPEVSVIALREDDAFFVIASDGIWDRMSDTEVVQFIQQRLGEHGCPQMASTELVNHAIMNLQSADNCACIVVVPRLNQTQIDPVPYDPLFS